MPDLIRFVDSIAASPTVRLDLNDESSFWVKSFNAAPPRLRRSVAANAMRDGINVGSAAYDGRTLTLEVEIRKSSQDSGATEMQKLWRELDRPTNIIQYQPQGASKPVFFRTFRSDASSLADVIAQAAMRELTVEILAEPFALGLKETMGPYTVSNDPTGTNPTYVDISTILGDVETPFVYWDTATGYARRWVVAAHTTSALASPWVQAEGMTLGTDTTNPGGGPDSLMSGTGTNNYLRTSFGTNANLTTRLTWAPTSAPRGRWRAQGYLRRSGSTSTLTVQMGSEPAVVVPSAVNARIMVDLGLVSFYETDPGRVGYSSVSAANAGSSVTFQASRSGGSDTLDWDGFLLLPVGGQAGEVDWPTQMCVAGGVSQVIDGIREGLATQSVAGDPTTGAGTVDSGANPATGAFPTLLPGAVNRLQVVPFNSTGNSAKAATTVVNIAYWPRYLHVRPVST